MTVKYRIVFFRPDPPIVEWCVPFGAVYKDTDEEEWTPCTAAVLPRYENPRLEGVFNLCLDQLVRQGLGVQDAGPSVHVGPEMELPPGVVPYDFLRHCILPGRTNR